MQVSIIYQFVIEKAIKSIWILFLILIFRKKLNTKSFKSANLILWGLYLAYLIIPRGFRIQFENNRDDLIGRLIGIVVFINEKFYQVLEFLGTYLFPLRRWIPSILLVFYFLYEIYSFYRVMRRSSLYENEKIREKIKSFGMEKEIEVYINDNLTSPISYGIFSPKIVLQSFILEDDKLLDHVLTHELVHIKNHHILFNHIINLLACLYWFNPFFWLSLKKIDQDIEINCDKEVIDRLGDTIKNRKDYSLSLFNFAQRQYDGSRIYLRMNYNVERLGVIKTYKKTLAGLGYFILILVLSLPVITSVNYIDHNKVTLVSGIGSEVVYGGKKSDRVKVLSMDQYDKLDKGDIFHKDPWPSKMNNRFVLPEYSTKGTEIKMASLRKNGHDFFTININELPSRKNLKYLLIIKENGEPIYEQLHTEDIILGVKTKKDCDYRVRIISLSNYTLSGNVSFNSYRE